jgi:hypothetical protein
VRAGRWVHVAATLGGAQHEARLFVQGRQVAGSEGPPILFNEGEQATDYVVLLCCCPVASYMFTRWAL